MRRSRPSDLICLDWSSEPEIEKDGKGAKLSEGCSVVRFFTPLCFQLLPEPHSETEVWEARESGKVWLRVHFDRFIAPSAPVSPSSQACLKSHTVLEAFFFMGPRDRISGTLNFHSPLFRAQVGSVVSSSPPSLPISFHKLNNTLEEYPFGFRFGPFLLLFPSFDNETKVHNHNRRDSSVVSDRQVISYRVPGAP